MATNTHVAPVASDTALNVQWRAIIAGAVGASALALSFTLSPAQSACRFRRPPPPGETHHGPWCSCRASILF
jgi:hypothetical protein